MPRTGGSRKFQLTFNNPLDHGFDHAVIRRNIEELKGVEYWCMCDEIGQEQKTPHTHLYMAFKNAKEFSAINVRFHGAHIETAKGTHRENRDYIRKEGKWRDDPKHGTNLPDTFEESGELPPESDKRKKQSEAVLDMVESGATNAQIIREYPSANLTNVEQIRQTLLEEEYRDKWRDLTVTYIWGTTGVGKTRSIMEKHGYSNVYRVTNYAHPFDGYKAQKVILFDEFRSSLPLSDMLVYLDGYPVNLPCRYSDRVACFDTVYIVSNISMEKQYPNVQREEPESYKAFLRRFDAVYELMPEYDGELPFKE